PGERDPRFTCLEVLTDLLDGGPTTRISDQLVDSGIAYSAGATLTAVPESSILSIELAIGHDKVHQALDAMLDLTTGVCAGIGRDELHRAAVRRRHAHRRRQDHARGWAEWAARRALFDLPLDAEAELRAQESVQIDDLVQLARQLFHRENLFAIVQGG